MGKRMRGGEKQPVRVQVHHFVAFYGGRLFERIFLNWFFGPGVIKEKEQQTVRDDIATIPSLIYFKL